MLFPDHDAKGCERGLLKAIPFVVSFSSCMDETARDWPDVILPSHMFLERI